MSELDASPAEPVLEWDTQLFRMAQTQFEQALPYADVSEMVAERLGVRLRIFTADPVYDTVAARKAQIAEMKKGQAATESQIAAVQVA